jgi:hypothetical protein
MVSKIINKRKVNNIYEGYLENKQKKRGFISELFNLLGDLD